MIGEYTFGPKLERDGVLFRLWAPAATKVDLLLDRSYSMIRYSDGCFLFKVPNIGAHAYYQFRIDDEYEIADPASAFQPDDVAGPSEIVDFATFQWKTVDWRSRPWSEAVVCELHVGTFTSEGTFRAAIERLDDLRETGFTAIELMPVADFPGRWNWGYDGVLPYAPDHRYGRPDDLAALVDAAHARGLMVFLDVVYNHLGPEGNCLYRIAPKFFSERLQTPWGAAIDFRTPQARRFVIENAVHWLDRYRFDGLRLDAVHAIVEAGDPHILKDISLQVCAFAKQSRRVIHLMLENDDNCAEFLDPVGHTSAGRYRAQWNDDYHHAWHVLLTAETNSYYRDYADAPSRHLARALTEGFAYQGEASRHRRLAKRGTVSSHLPPCAFLNFLQNHDQIGNRPHGDRLSASVPACALRAALAVTLLVPMPVLMFMGEDWGSQKPFPYFCDFAGDLGRAIREGRQRELVHAYDTMASPLPDPLACTTFSAAKLDWAERLLPEHAVQLAMVRALLVLRRSEIIPHFATSSRHQARADGNVIVAEWTGSGERVLRLTANIGDCEETPNRDLIPPGRPIWGGAQPSRLPPWAVYWSIATPLSRRQGKANGSESASQAD